MKYLLTAAAIVTLLACTKTETIAPTGHAFAAKSVECDSLQALVDSLQQDKAELCITIQSISKHWDQAAKRTETEASNCCEWYTIVYQEMYLIKYYIEQANSTSVMCEPAPLELFFLYPAQGCPYPELPQ